MILPTGRPRLIPAHAGKTTSNSRSPSSRKAHPRSCGENAARIEVRDWPAGSSPLTRGKPRGCVGRLVTDGLIPAHAGKTARVAFPAAISPAHPHSHGENLYVDVVPSIKGGSSPLTRGKPRGRSHGPPSRRLIPTHAGKTCEFQLAGRRAWAHPHSCGENGISFVRAIFKADSSPLMRGKRGMLLRALSGPGLIPADAGKHGVELGVRLVVRLIPAHAGKTWTSSRRRR